MKKQEFLQDAIGQIDEKLIKQAKEPCKMIRTKKKPILILVACLLLVAILIPAAMFAAGYPPFGLPVYNGPLMTAEQVESIMPRTVGVATNNYSTEYALTPEGLNITPMPGDKYLIIYQNTAPTGYANIAKLQADAEEIFPRLSAALNIPIPEYQILADPQKKYESVSIREEWGNNLVILGNSVNFSMFLDINPSTHEPIVLNGITVQYNETQTDEEIIESLAPVKEVLSQILGQTFEDTRVERFVTQTDSKITDIYFYNKCENIAHPLGGTVESNYIKISPGFRSENGIVTDLSIYYYKFSENYQFYQQPRAKVKRISLQEAEELLQSGYSFGGNTCHLCMAEQDAIDFEEYDYAGLEYIRIDDTDVTLAYYLPFYAFYKFIEKNQYGTLVYGVTYVPAFEVSEVEEYFEKKAASHAEAHK